MFMSKKHSFSSLFSSCHVYFGFQISSVEANLVYFSIFSIVSVFLAFKTYLILKFFCYCKFAIRSGPVERSVS